MGAYSSTGRQEARWTPGEGGHGQRSTHLEKSSNRVSRSVSGTLPGPPLGDRGGLLLLTLYSPLPRRFPRPCPSTAIVTLRFWSSTFVSVGASWPSSCFCGIPPTHTPPAIQVFVRLCFTVAGGCW